MSTITSALESKQARFRELDQAIVADFERHAAKENIPPSYMGAFKFGSAMELLMSLAAEDPRLLEKLEARYLP